MRNEGYRNHVANEILSSEQKYCESLNILLKVRRAICQTSWRIRAHPYERVCASM